METVLDLPKSKKMEFKTQPKWKNYQPKFTYNTTIKTNACYCWNPTMMDSSLLGMKYEKKAFAQNTNPQIFKYLLAVKNN